MTDTLDISRLIEKTEKLVYDGKINMAERGEVKIQDIEIFGREYELSVTLKMKS